MDHRENGYTSVRRALTLLSRFERHHEMLSVAELARGTGLDKSVVTRLMATMAEEGFVIQDPESRRYMVGPMLFSVGAMYRPSVVFRHVALVPLRDLAASCGHTCTLGIPIGREALTVISIEAPPANVLRVPMVVGGRRPLYIGALGKVLLAAKTDTEVRDMFGDGALEQWTPYTPATVERLLAELAEIRRRGYATNWQESLLGSGGVAAPVVDAMGDTVAGVVISFPIQLVSDEEIEGLAQLAIEAANRIARDLQGIPRRDGIAGGAGRRTLPQAAQ